MRRWYLARVVARAQTQDIAAYVRTKIQFLAAKNRAAKNISLRKNRTPSIEFPIYIAQRNHAAAVRRHPPSQQPFE
jgi:hypothetical protein